jgi:hypothetical protein
MEITFDVLNQIPRLFKEILSIIQEPLDRRRERRKAFFDTEIAPIHGAMVEINADYMKCFEELLELLTTDKDLPRTLELLKKNRLVLVMKRQETLAYADTLKTVKKRGYIKQREIAAFVDFAEGIKAYVKGASPVDMRVSWYSAFIDEFEAIMKRGEHPSGHREFRSISTGRPPVDLVRDAYQAAVQKDIPEAWNQYMKAFQKLKLELQR